MAARACGLFFQHVEPTIEDAFETISRALALLKCAKDSYPICSRRATTVGPMPLTARRAFLSDGKNGIASSKKYLTNSVYLPRGQARVMGDVHTRQINLVGLNQRPEWPLVEIQGIAQAPPADRHKLCPDSGCFRVFISVPRAPIQTNQAGWVGLCAWLLWPASARHSARTAPPRTPLPSA